MKRMNLMRRGCYASGRWHTRSFAVPFLCLPLLSLPFLSLPAMLLVGLTVQAQNENAAPARPAPDPLPALSDDWSPLGEKDKVWINVKSKQVAVDGEVCLNKGYLEMFACISNTKEHESVVALRSHAFVVHAALLRIGAKHGSPAVFRPNYRPASGDVIEVWVEWMVEGKLRRIRAQEWIRDLKTQKQMEHEWVFAGSGIVKDPETDKSYYRAEGGELICVSNFPVAMMDLPIQSSDANDELVFEAFTEHIPARHTPVRVYLIPKDNDRDEEKTPPTTSTSTQPKP